MQEKVTDYKDSILSKNLSKNLKIFHNVFKNDTILRERYLNIANTKCALLYFDGMVNITALNDSVVRPIILSEVPLEGDIAETLEKEILYAADVMKTGNVADILRAILYGDTLLLIDGCATGLIINTKGWRTRGISEPQDERILQGPREGFDEAAMFNVAMIRRKLLTPDLCIEMRRIGRRTDTLVFICYLGSLVNKKTVKLLKERLDKIDIDGILDTNYINELVRDRPLSVFKTTGTTERPDIVAARLLEGRIAVVVDGTPVVLTLPYLFSENFQSDEDYYISFLAANVGRFLRFLCFILAISVPAFYLALTTFHPHLLPTSFALSVASSREGVPFSSFFECILLVTIFEVLKETGLRMPQSVGHALSIVGGLVVGQAAVEAKLVSAPMLIAVSLSGIAGLMIPRLKAAVVYGRYFMILLSSYFGFWGLFCGGAIIIGRVLSLNSFGVSETASLLAPTLQGLKDILWRLPWSYMETRPNLNLKNSIRMRKVK